MKREELKVYYADLELQLYKSNPFPGHDDTDMFIRKSEADKVMDAMEARIKELEDKNRHLGIIAMLDVDMLKMAEQIHELEAENEKLKAQVPKWISVKDRLPEEQSDVLFIDVDGLIHIGDMWKGKAELYWYGRAEPRSLNVTHWMQLPPPPATEESSATEKENG